MAQEDDALRRAVRLLARRDHSTASLRAKLERAGASEREQAEAIEALARAGYLDDARFARARAEQLADRGYGDEWIRADLDAHGVSHEFAVPALEELIPERKRALHEAEALGGGLRAARTLQRRGFSEDALEGVLHGTVADDP